MDSWTFWSNRIIRTCFYLLFGLVPLLLTPWNYELFEFNKMMAVYFFTVIITGAWIVKMITERQIRIAKTPLDIPIALFVASQLISTLFSLDPHVSWFGYYSRFNGGFLSICSYVLLYYAFITNFSSSIFNSQFSILNLIKIALFTASLISIYAVAEHFGIDKNLWVQDVQNRVFSTLGQPNWLAAYLVALMPITMAFALKSQIPKPKIQTISKLGFIWNLEFGVWNLTAILFFLVLLFTRSRSGMLAFAVVDILFWFFVFKRPPLAILQGEALRNMRKNVFRIFLFLHFAFLILVFINGTHIDVLDKWVTYDAWKQRVQSNNKQQTPPLNNLQPTTYNLQPALETGGTESGTIRKYVWQGALNAWRSSVKTILIGTGTETFAFAFYRFKPVGHNLTSEWDFLYNKAHNEYLNFLTTTGIFGLGSYLCLIGSFIFWFIKSQITNHKSQEFKIWNLSLFIAWLSLLITNFFGFSVVVTQLLFFLLPAIVFSSNNLAIQQFNNFLFPLSFSSKKQQILMPLICLLSSVISLLIIVFWYADKTFAAGYRLTRAGKPAEAYPYFSRAIILNPFEPLYHDEFAGALSTLTAAALENHEATAASRLAGESLTQNEQAIRTSPNNINYWKSRTKILFAFSSFDPSFLPLSITALNKATLLAPYDPKIVYNLAILWAKSGDMDQAVEYAKKSINLKPNYRDPYYAMWIFLKETNRLDEGRAIIQKYLDTVNPEDTEFQELLQ